jgi:hypothetical protein
VTTKLVNLNLQHNKNKIVTPDTQSACFPVVANIEEVQSALIEREKTLSASEENNRRLRAELEMDKQAIARTIELLANPSAELPLDLTPTKKPARRSVGIKKAVGESIRVLGQANKIFSSRDVINYLLSLPHEKKPDFDVKKNRANISSYLRDFVEEDLIEERGEASGRRPATYRLVDQQMRIEELRRQIIG